MESKLMSVEPQGAHEAGGTPMGGAPTLVDRVWAPLVWFFPQVFFIYSKINLH